VPEAGNDQHHFFRFVQFSSCWIFGIQVFASHKAVAYNMAVPPVHNTATGTSNSSMPDRIPAWKRLGLKLKNAKETQGGTIAPTNGASPQELKRSLSGTHLVLDPEPRESWVEPVTKRRRLGSDTTESARSNGSLNRTSNIFSTAQSAKLRKKVSFTAETKLEDGGKELITDWEHDDYAYYEQKAADNDAKEALRVASDAQNKPHKPSTHPQKPSDTPRKSKDALEYLDSYCRSRRSWKFNKNREVWILRHILSSDDIPTSFNIALASYVHGLGSKQARLRLLNQCQEALDKEVPEEPSRNETGSDSGHMEDPNRRKAYHDDAVKRFKRSLENHLDHEQRKADEDDPDYQRWLSRRRRAELLLWAVTPSPPSTEGVCGSSQDVRSEPHTSTSAKLANGVLPSGRIPKKKNRTAVVEVSSSSEDESGSSNDDGEDGSKVVKENDVLNRFTQSSTSPHESSSEASGSDNDSHSDSDSGTAASRPTGSTSSSDDESGTDLLFASGKRQHSRISLSSTGDTSTLPVLSTSDETSSSASSTDGDEEGESDLESSAVVGATQSSMGGDSETSSNSEAEGGDGDR